MRERSSASPSERLDIASFRHLRLRRGCRQAPGEARSRRRRWPKARLDRRLPASRRPHPQPHPNVAAPRRADARPKSPIRRSNPPTPLEVAAKIARKSGNQPLTIQTVAHPALRATFSREGGRRGFHERLQMSAHPSVRTEIDGPVSTILLSRPEKRNAVDGPMASALTEA